MTVSESHLVEEFRRHESFLRAFIARQVPNRVQSQIDPEDVLQETYSDAWLHASEFSGDGSMLAWLKSIAQRNLIDRLRAVNAKKRGGDIRNWRVGTGAHSSSSGVAVAAMLPSPSSIVAGAEAQAFVESCIQDLSPRYRKVLTLRFFEHKSVDEVAAAMEVSNKATHMLIQRAIAQLRSRILINSDL